MSQAPITIFYHADCLDGFGAAYAAWCHFGENAHYRPMHHGEAWDQTAISGHEVYVLDFSFPPAQLRQMASLAKSVTQIDHHASAMRPWTEQLTEAPNGCKKFTADDQSLTVIFNLEKSGSRLAWEFFHPEHPTPLPLLHIEDQDLWHFTLPDTRAFCRALRMESFEFAAWHGLFATLGMGETPRCREFLAVGYGVERFFEREVLRLADSGLCMQASLRGEPIDPLQAMRHGQPTLTDGHSSWLQVLGLAVNANVLFASELGNLLAERSGTFGMVWQYAADGEIRVSLRAKGNVDVSKIATRYGGGGHPNAAGFRLSANRFFAETLLGDRSGEDRPRPPCSQPTWSSDE